MVYQQGAWKNAVFMIVFAMVDGMHDGWGYIEPYIASY